MRSEFTTSALDDLCSLIVDCPHSTPEWTEDGITVLRSKNIRNGRLNLEAQKSFTNEEGYLKRVGKAIPQGGDLVITREAPMGEVCILPSGLKCCLGQRMVLLRPNRSCIDNRYLLFAIQSPFVQHEILINEGTGSTVSNLRIPVLKSLPIPLPPLAEQKRIAALLGSLDDLIELNRKMNQTLEEMAQAIFKSWFIDFDGVPEEDLVESELGLIPRGWEVISFDQIGEIVRTTVKPQDLKDVEFAHFSLPAFDSNELPVFELGGDIKSNKYQVYEDSFLLSKLNPRIPRVWLPNFVNINNPICSTEFLVIRPRNGYSIQHLYSMVKSHTFYYQLLSRVAGTTGSHQRVKPKDVLSIKVIKASEEIVTKYQKVASHLYSQIHNHIQQSQTLAELRDTLLPKLISGELRIPEAEEQVTDALS